MHGIKEQSREQLVMFPEAVEDYISSSAPVRFIDRFVDTDTLDFKALGFKNAS